MRVAFLFRKEEMKKVILFLILIAFIDIFFLVQSKSQLLPSWWYNLGLIAPCALVGGLGGTIYCLRGVYLNACVRKDWSPSWLPWYYIRPLVSHLCGAISYLFLKAGLILLEAKETNGSTAFGFLCLAFIAGLNVDKFINKIEDIAQASFGIEKSRTGKDTEK